MSMMQEFKAFASKGNVVDLAVGVIIGGAFGKIVDSLVGCCHAYHRAYLRRSGFSNYYLPLNGQGTTLTLIEAKKAGGVLAYGSFITVVSISDSGLYHFSDGAPV
jgi:large conductance mechanosensitive channel